MFDNQATPVQATQSRQTMRVHVVDIEMSFGSMVVFMVKLALASIPAAIIFWMFMFGMAVLFSGLTSGALMLL